VLKPLYYLHCPKPKLSAFPKGGRPSSVGKYFSTGKMIGKCAHQSFAASHSHNTLGSGSPNNAVRENRITQTVIDFPLPWFILVLNYF
jgi:hypothetical protein